MQTQPAIPATRRPSDSTARLQRTVRRETAQERRAREVADYEDKLQHLAGDIENILAAKGCVEVDDLTTRGWSLPTLAEIQTEALDIVRARAERQIGRATPRMS